MELKDATALLPFIKEAAWLLPAQSREHLQSFLPDAANPALRGLAGAELSSGPI